MSATKPVFGYVNYLARTTTVLASADVISGSSIRNLVDPNLSAVADFGTGEDRAATADFGAGVALQPTLFFARLRGKGWPDLTGVRLRLSNNSDLSSPEKDTTLPVYFLSPWTDEHPVRPIVVALWDAVTACRYVGLNYLRTAGLEPLEVAYNYLGEHVELKSGSGVGLRSYGSSIGTLSHSRKTLTGLQGHAFVAGATQRGAKIRNEAKSKAHVQSEWYPKFLLSAADRPVVYWCEPTSTDPIVLQSQVLLGTAGVGRELEVTVKGYESWEQEIEIEEIL